MAVKKGGLGKGLSALLAENTMEEAGKTISLRIGDITPNRDQPRKQFDDEPLGELADSIARHGVLQPLLVRPLPDGGYQLVAGERRWRAARQAGLTEVPVVVREMTGEEASVLALVENLQRENLNPMEEALGFRMLMDEQGLTQEEASKIIGKSRPAVANALRLLGLPEPVREMVSEGRLSGGHARAVLAFPDEESQREAADLAVKKGCSVRELEQMAKSRAKKPKSPTPAERDRFYDEVELSLTEHLGRRVKVQASGKGGTLQIEFYSTDDLRMLANEFDETTGQQTKK